MNSYDSNTHLSLVAPSLFLEIPNTMLRLREECVAKVSLVNTNQMALVVNGRFQIIPDDKYPEAFELAFSVFGLDHMLPILPLSVVEDRLLAYPQQGDYVYLEPYGRHSRILTLSAYFNLESPGAYKVIATYHNDHTGHEFGLNAWTGKLVSSPISFIRSEK